MAILNFRELTSKANRNGIAIKENTIFRSGNPMNADEDDVNRLVEFGVNYVYDFRSISELENDGQKDFFHAQIIHIDILSDAGMGKKEIRKFLDKPEETFTTMYRQAFPNTVEYRHFIQSIIDQQTPALLFHCTAGRDRTGIAGVILMHILEFDLKDIYEEFLKMDSDIFDAMKQQMKGLLRQMGIENPGLDVEQLMIPKKQELDAFFEGIEEYHGSLDKYIKGFLGVSETDRTMLRKRYMKS